MQALKNAQHIKRKVTPLQARQIFGLCGVYDQDGSLMLDIGTYCGFSAAMMAQAAPRAKIVTLNIKDHEIEIARKNLAKYANVEIVQAVSWYYLRDYAGGLFDFIFVDGDHNNVNLDLGWWQHLVSGGLMLFHDYNEPGHGRDSPRLRAILDRFAKERKRPFDVHLIDENGAGMVGFYRWEEHHE